MGETTLSSGFGTWTTGSSSADALWQQLGQERTAEPRNSQRKGLERGNEGTGSNERGLCGTWIVLSIF